MGQLELEGRGEWGGKTVRGVFGREDPQVLLNNRMSRAGLTMERDCNASLGPNLLKMALLLLGLAG